MDDLIRWSSLAMPLVLGVSTFIAVRVYLFTRRAARVQTLSLAHSRWHDINRVLIERPQLQRHFRDPRFEQKSDDEIVVYNMAFQIVNTCAELYTAGQEGLIEPAVAAASIHGSLAIFRGRPELLREILDWRTGSDPAFTALMQAGVGDERTPHGAGTAETISAATSIGNPGPSQGHDPRH